MKLSLHKSEPWSRQECKIDKCPPCLAPEIKKGGCRTRSITYKSVCRICLKYGVTTKYIGESARDIYLRGVEHTLDAEKHDQGSHIWNHLQEKHPEVKPGPWFFCMRVLKAHRSALIRQVYEAILVRQQQDTILNSKTEYSRCYDPQLG